MNFGGIFIFVLAIVVFNWIARPVEAFFLCIREWRAIDKSERREIIACAIATSLFFLIICSAPAVYQTYFKGAL